MKLLKDFVNSSALLDSLLNHSYCDTFKTHNIMFYFLFSVQWLLRMINYTLTEDTFRHGLSKFLQEKYALLCVFSESEANKY